MWNKKNKRNVDQQNKSKYFTLLPAQGRNIVDLEVQRNDIKQKDKHSKGRDIRRRERQRMGNKKSKGKEE